MKFSSCQQHPYGNICIHPNHVGKRAGPGSVVQAQADRKEQEEQEQVEREEWDHTEQEECEKIEAARVAAEKEEVRKVQRATKGAEKWKATEEVVEGDKVVVVEGPSEEPRPKKRVRTSESNVGPDGEPEMEGVEAECKRSVILVDFVLGLTGFM